MPLSCKPPRSRARDERGASALEFALIAPLLCALVYGIIQYGTMLSFRQGLSQATAEGARAAALAAPTAAAPYDPISQGQFAIASALGDGYACNSQAGTLTRSSAVVGTCRITPTAGCTQSSGRCTYTVNVAFDYEKHPVVPTFLVPMPKTLTYQSSAQGNPYAPATTGAS